MANLRRAAGRLGPGAWLWFALFVLGACSVAGPPQAGGASAVGGSAGAFGTPIGPGALASVPAPSCTSTNERDVEFSAQSVAPNIGISTELYAWVNASEAERLRRDQVLLPESADSRVQRGYAFDALATFRSSYGEPDAPALARALVDDWFPSVLRAWPNPWASRFGFPDEPVGEQLVRIELRSDSLLVSFDRRTLRVLNALGQDMAISSALAAPERVAAL
ncbi:MAG: hypothetical protein QM756_45850 [Polyangiaceae bacterium]